MPFCSQCGTQYDEGTKFCPSCGAKAEAPAGAKAAEGEYRQHTEGYRPESYRSGAGQESGAYQPGAQARPQYQQSAGESKTMAILAVIFPVLFFLPLVVGEKDEYGSFWANQSLLLLICYAVLSLIGYIPIVRIFSGIAGLAVVVFHIIGIVSACKGEMKPLPLIGTITIIK